MRIRLFILLLAILPASGPALADAARAARLDKLQDDILGAASATRTLTAYCAALHLADPAVVTAAQDKGAASPATAGIRAQLKVDAAEPLRYRRVQLKCGGQILSVADNWYVPSRLTPAMNDSLDHSDTPFGTVVQPLNFHRRVVEKTAPIPRDAMAAGNAQLDANLPDATVFQVEAVLLTPQDLPISLVIENYRGTLLAPPKP